MIASLLSLCHYPHSVRERFRFGADSDSCSGKRSFRAVERYGIPRPSFGGVVGILTDTTGCSFAWHLSLRPLRWRIKRIPARNTCAHLVFRNEICRRRSTKVAHTYRSAGEGGQGKDSDQLAIPHNCNKKRMLSTFFFILPSNFPTQCMYAFASAALKQLPSSPRCPNQPVGLRNFRNIHYSAGRRPQAHT